MMGEMFSSEAGKPLIFKPIRESSGESQLMAITYDVVLPFDRDEEGALKLGEPKEAPDAGSAERRWGVSHHDWSRTMTFSRIAPIAVAVVAMASGFRPAFAIADNAARINQCVIDNKAENQTATVVAACCSCMNNNLLFLHEQQDVRLGDAVDHHLGEVASQRAKGLLRGSGREEQIEGADLLRSGQAIGSHDL
jgi:hypothetical protein